MWEKREGGRGGKGGGMASLSAIQGSEGEVVGYNDLGRIKMESKQNAPNIMRERGW